jgi:uncharacterized membrane protein YkoI
MDRKRLVAGGAAIAVAASVGTWAVVAAVDDPDERVDTVQLGAISTGGSATTGALEVLAGNVEHTGEDVDDLTVDGIELDFGPDEWVTSAGAVGDLDADGRDEDLAAELEGLVGQDVDLRVAFDDDGERDDADVYEVGDVVFREAGGPAPWDGDAGAGEATEEAVARTAEAEIGEGARAGEVERDAEDGSVTWEVEVVDADGREHTVVLNAAGDVLGSSVDD